MNREPRFDQNYFLALVLSMLVLFGYSYYLQKMQQGTPRSAAHATPAKEPTVLNPKDSGSGAAMVKPASLETPSEPEILEFKNSLYDVELSSLGGTIKRLIFKGEKQRSGISGVSFFDGRRLQPGLFGIRIDGDSADLSRTLFTAKAHPDQREAFEFQHEKAGEFRLTKRFYFGDEPIVGFEIEIENLSTAPKRFPFVLDYALLADVPDKDKPASESVALIQQKIKGAPKDKFTKKPWSLSGEIVWSGLIRKYFALLIKPEQPAVRVESRAYGDEMHSELYLAPADVPAGGSVHQQFFIYAGPQRYETLAGFRVGFEDLMAKGFFGTFKILLLKSLKFLETYCHNFGWAILLLTFVLKLLFAPLTHMSFESMRKMQALQPKIKSLQERYKKDPSKMNAEMMELYKKHRVNPMGGCLPMLLQIPIFIAFYQMLNDAIELKGAPFIFWVKDLAEPDRLFTLPFSIPFVGDAFNILPLFMVGSMVVQQQMTPQMGTTPEQAKMMNVMMPVVFGLLFYNMPSGLVLYWFANNVLSIIHQGFVKKVMVIPHHHEET